MPTLQEIIQCENLALSKNPYGTDKGDYKSYVDGFYQPYFSKRQSDSINLMEIGYRHGASLALWSSFFRQGSILGIDNGSDQLTQENGPVEAWINRSNIKALVADAYDKQYSDTLNQSFDIIIDDGPHSLGSQIQAIKLYLNKLRVNGYFVVEDIQRIGGLCLFYFLPLVPLNYRIDFFDFRANKKGNDDLLFVITFSNKYELQNRVILWIRAFTYLIREPIAYIQLRIMRFINKYLVKF